MSPTSRHPRRAWLVPPLVALASACAPVRLEPPPPLAGLPASRPAAPPRRDALVEGLRWIEERARPKARREASVEAVAQGRKP